MKLANRALRILAVASISWSVSATTVWAGGDPAMGKEKSQVCAGCHGADGNSTLPANPIIAGQFEDYLVHALKAYRDGGRKNAIMAGMVANLSDADIADLAAYFASQESALRTVPDY